jgi:hypothetical protein
MTPDAIPVNMGKTHDFQRPPLPSGWSPASPKDHDPSDFLIPHVPKIAKNGSRDHLKVAQ